MQFYSGDRDRLLYPAPTKFEATNLGDTIPHGMSFEMILSTLSLPNVATTTPGIPIVDLQFVTVRLQLENLASAGNTGVNNLVSMNRAQFLAIKVPDVGAAGAFSTFTSQNFVKIENWRQRTRIILSVLDPRGDEIVYTVADAVPPAATTLGVQVVADFHIVNRRYEQ